MDRFIQSFPIILVILGDNSVDATRSNMKLQKPALTLANLHHPQNMLIHVHA